MYAIACIFSYDGLPTAIYDQEINGALLPNNTDNNISQWGKRRSAYIAPSDFLKSLIFGKQPVNSHRSTAVNCGNQNSTSNSLKALHPGGSAPRTAPFKRRR